MKRLHTESHILRAVSYQGSTVILPVEKCQTFLFFSDRIINITVS